MLKVCNQIVSAACQDRRLCAGRVVFRQLADLLEQLRAHFVIKIEARQPLLCVCKTFAYIGGEVSLGTLLCRSDQGQAPGRAMCRKWLELRDRGLQSRA